MDHRWQEAAGGIRKDDGKARRAERDRQIRSVVAVEVAERAESGSIDKDGFGRGEVPLTVVAQQRQVVGGRGDHQILIAVAIDVGRAEGSTERNRERGHERQRARAVVGQQPQRDWIAGAVRSLAVITSGCVSPLKSATTCSQGPVTVDVNRGAAK